AVVAEEVRRLAENSAQSTEQISSLIRTIQKETAKAVSSVQIASKEIEEGRVGMDRVCQALDKISKAAGQTAVQVDQIASASEAQLISAQEVSKTIEKVAAFAEQSASSTQQASSSVEEVTASMEEMSANAQELAEMSSDLREQVRMFKIKEPTPKEEPSLKV
ncbi:MAG: methyl-accepting chemotaxis protein, partial [Candidatus Firestonebacteria bacterium]